MTKFDDVLGGPKTRSHTHPNSGLLVILKRIRGLTQKGMLKHSYHFQIAPLEEFGWDSAYNWLDYDTIERGQFTKDGGRQLKAVSFSSLVVDWNPAWAIYIGGRKHHPAKQEQWRWEHPDQARPGVHTEPGGPAPNVRQVAHDLDKMINQGTIMRLVAWNRGLWRHPDVNMPVTMRTYSVRERAGEPDSRYFDLSFVEYRRPQLRRRGYQHTNRGNDLPALVFIDERGIGHELDLGGESGGVSANPRTGVTIGTRAHPATLRKLSKHYYGENNEWKRIARKNSIHHMGPDDDLDKLNKRGRKHMRLTIPRIKRPIEPAVPVWGDKERK